MARQSANQEASASARPKRAPLSQRNRLEVRNKEAGFTYRIVNDIDDRVQQLEERGWQIVPDAKVGAVGNRRVDNTTPLGTATSISVGHNIKAVVMRIPEDWFREDAEAKEAQLKEIEQTMRQEARKNADYGELAVNR